MGKIYLFPTFLLVAVVISAATSLSIDSSKIELEKEPVENQRVRFYGYQVFRARPETEEQFKALISLHTGDPQLDFWRVSHELGDFSDVMVAPEKNAFFQEYLESQEIPYELHIPDVERLVKEERRMNDEARKGKASRVVDWASYNNLEEIYGWVDQLALAYPDLVQFVDIGTTSEDRPIKCIRISTDPEPNENKPVIIIDGGIHAREWISPACVTYLINELVMNPDGKYSGILDKLDFYIIPVLNPDGYDYTFTKERLWRKNRRPNVGSNCIGTDLNRNFDFHWAEVGSSTSPCSEIYHGRAGCSEAESQALKFLLETLKTAKSRSYMTFHSYGQYILSPWGYTKDYPEDYYTHLAPAAEAMRDAIKPHENKDYTIGTSTNALYAAAGGSDDFAKGVGGCKYSYCIELRDTGATGFVLPPEQIKPTCIETMMGFKAICEAIITKMEL